MKNLLLLIFCLFAFTAANAQAPQVTSVNSTTNGTYKAGDIIVIHVNFDLAVNVSGSPKLFLETGQTSAYATYSSGSNTTSLVFNYVVRQNDHSSDLDYNLITALDNNGGFIKKADLSVDADLTLPAPGTANSLSGTSAVVIDAVQPTVLSVSGTNGTYIAGEELSVSVVFSEPVLVSGAPTLALNTYNAGTHIAQYVSGSGSNTLVFDYTVVSGDNTSDLNYSTANALVLGTGVSIKDAVTNDAILALPALSSANSLAGTSALVVDGIVPTITGVTSIKSNGYYKDGAEIIIQLQFSEDVTVAGGTPKLILETGGADETLSYSGMAIEHNTLNFTYTVDADDASSDLDYIASSPFRLEGATIRDAALNNADITLPAPGASGSLAYNKNLVIDNTAPTVASVSSLNSGPYKIGQIVTVKIQFSEDILLSGSPKLVLETGAEDRTVSYSSSSGANILNFNYMVQSGDNSLALNYIDVNSLRLNGAIIKDRAGNTANITLPAPGAGLGTPAGSIVIKGIPTTVSSVTSSNSDASPYKSGSITVNVVLSGIVTVAGVGTPTLLLETGTINRTATYTVGTGTNTLSFAYTITAGDYSADLDYYSINSLSLNGATVTDANGNNAVLTLPAPGKANSLAGTKNLIVDAIAPSVKSVSSTTVNGTYKSGVLIPLQIKFSEPVTVSGGTPQLVLETGGVDETATYFSGSTTNTLTFNYTVGATATSADLDYVSSTSLKLNGATIADAAGNNAVLTLAAPGAAGSLGYSKAIVIDNTAPTISAVSTNDFGTMVAGEVVTMSVSFTTPVYVTGVPQIELETGITNRFATYQSGSSTSTLIFKYVIKKGDQTADLDYIGTGALTTPVGSAIKDKAGNNATLTLPSNLVTPNGTIVIEGIIPVVTAVNSSTTGTYFKTGDAISIEVNFNTNVTVSETAPNLPRLLLETGTTDQYATYTSGSGSAVLVFSYTVVAGDNSADLNYKAINSLSLNGSTIKDAHGNVAVLTLPETSSLNSLAGQEAFVVDAIPPTVLDVNSTKTNGHYNAGEVIPIQVKFSEPITVAGGTPQLVLATGGAGETVNCVLPVTASNTMTFNYTVGATAVSPDLNYVSTSSLKQNGATIRDAATNNAVLTLPAPGLSGSLGYNKAIIIDNTQNTVVSVTTNEQGTLLAGEAVTFSVVFSDVVYVTGMPKIQLETGTVDHYANFVSGSASNTLLFKYIVQQGDETPNLNYLNPVTSFTGTITDKAGNAAILSLPALTKPGTIVISAVLPTVVDVTTTTVDDSYSTGTISVNVKFSKSVTITGAPKIILETGTIDKYAVYDGSSSGTNILFNYTIGSGDYAADLNYKATNSLILDGGTIKDGVGNNAILTLPALSASTSLGGSKKIVVDAIAPNVVSVLSTTINGYYNAGDVIKLTVGFNEIVEVSGTPELALETGAIDGVATYASGSGTKVLSFDYTVKATDVSADLSYIGTNSLTLAGGSTITDVAGNNANLTLAAPGAIGSLSYYRNIVLDNVGPTVLKVSASNADGLYNTGTNIYIKVYFSKSVYVSGRPQLALNTTPARSATYYSGNGSNTLIFKYTVVYHDAAGDLDYAATNALSLNGGAIKDISGNNANLALVAPGAAGSLGAAKAIQIDATNVSKSAHAGADDELTAEGTDKLIFNVYPIPSQGNLFIEMTEFGEIDKDILVFDNFGRMVYSKKTNVEVESIHLNVPPGIYTLIVQNEMQKSTRKIVVQ
jgi:hypothetical protein